MFDKRRFIVLGATLGLLLFIALVVMLNGSQSQAKALQEFLDSNQATPQEREASLATDRRSRLRATIVGSPLRNHADGSLKRFDEEGIPLEADDPTPGNYEFVLYEPVLINGVFVPPEQRGARVLVDGDVLAIWPPIAGG